MNKLVNIFLVLIVFVLILLGSGAIYIVDETQQAVITQFGQPIGQPITQAGLYFKLPVVQKANYFEKRILEWDGDANQIPTRDKRYIWVDTTARWRIVDSLKFMQSVGTEISAQSRLDDIIDAATRDTISNLNLLEAVRDSNDLITRAEQTPSEDDFDLEKLKGVSERVEVGRENLTREIIRRSAQAVPSYGIQLIDVRIKRINYVQDVRKKVYERMISERKRAAEKFRSEGQGKKAEIEGQMTKELEQIQSEAYKQAQEVKGKADAEAINIYAEAYDNDPEFYSFLRTLETYKDTIGNDTTLILSTESDFYKYLKSMEGGGF